MKKAHLLLSICCFLNTDIVGQIVVSGKVFSGEVKYPMSQVIIKVLGFGMFANSDENGLFMLKIPGDSATLEFSNLGYHDEIVHVKQSIAMEIIMKEDSFAIFPYGRYSIKTIKEGNHTTEIFAIDTLRFQNVKCSPCFRWIKDRIIFYVPKDSVISFVNMRNYNANNEREFIETKKLAEDLTREKENDFLLNSLVSPSSRDLFEALQFWLVDERIAKLYHIITNEMIYYLIRKELIEYTSLKNKRGRARSGMMWVGYQYYWEKNEVMSKTMLYGL